MKINIFLVAAVLLAGCAERQYYAPKLQVHDANTVHNTNPSDATRVWVIQTGSDGNQRVVLCDMAFMGVPMDPRRLCVVWPNQ